MELFFARADTLGDPFEGSTTQAEIEQRHFITENRRSLDFWKDLSDEQFEKLMKSQENFPRSMVPFFCVNCWHISEHESMPMWSSYGQSKESLALVTKFGKMKHALSENVFAGRVKYIDYRRDIIPNDNILNKIIHKRKYFSQENELRFVIWDTESIQNSSDFRFANPNNNGISVSIELESAIDEIRIHPQADRLFSEVVRGLVQRYDLKIKISDSEISGTPAF